MKIFSKMRKKTLSISVIMLSIVWCLAMISIADSYEPAVLTEGGITGFIASIVISVVYLSFLSVPVSDQTAESGCMSVLVTLTYLLISCVMNTVFIVTGNGGAGGILLISNLTIDVIFVILIIYVEKNAAHIANHLKHAEKITVNHENLSRMLAELVSLSKDDEIRQKLLSLKENIDYSSTISVNNNFDLEAKLQNCLLEIRKELEISEDHDDIIRKINYAESVWNCLYTGVSDSLQGGK